MVPIDPSEITPEAGYLNRRAFMKGAGALAAGVVAGCGPDRPDPSLVNVEPGPVVATTDELGDELTPYEDIVSYNNYYEFSSNKDAVAKLSQDFETTPWTVEVGGLVENPRTYDLSDLSAMETEERIYRLRCVEGWSMVIPWVGFPLARILDDVQPTDEAQFVRFESVHRPEQMPGQGRAWFDWPYVEGLRLDEAYNDLTLMATGCYGKALLNQNGAPIRLVVPWKYGFKSAKAIVKIDLVPEQPVSFWIKAAPREYGFYANVNPDVPHPRWSQSTERRIGELRRRKTLIFNGYADEVAHLYEGMDLSVQF